MKKPHICETEVGLCVRRGVPSYKEFTDSLIICACSGSFLLGNQEKIVGGISL